MIKVDGREIARKIIEELKKRPRPEKMLAAIFVGENEASAAFLKRKEAIAAGLGVQFHLHRLAESISQVALEEKVREVAYDPAVGGVVVQLPLPARFHRDAVLKNLNLRTDVDALVTDELVEPPAVGVVKAILENQKSSIMNYGVVAVVGKGFLVGRPVVRWLEQERIKNQELRIKRADSATENLAEFLADADLVITGVGKAGLIKPEWLKAGAGVIDFGFPPDFNMGTSQDTVSCDVQKLSFYTPTPGGTGPILVAKLFENFYSLSLISSS